MQVYYDAVDEFQRTHDIDAIYDEWGKLADIARQRELAVGAATDTFDGGVMGAFGAFLMLGGHTPEYLSHSRMGVYEGVANVFSNLVTGNPLEREAFLDLCPHLYNLIAGRIRI